MEKGELSVEERLNRLESLAFGIEDRIVNRLFALQKRETVPDSEVTDNKKAEVKRYRSMMVEEPYSMVGLDLVGPFTADVFGYTYVMVVRIV